ncbi:hypothetical protein VTP01DRAFT_7245 [Rhizomucor pusillus]|uniref:uncharacterized protein n=1 Tax=Rhizomucor pusillus TaxID=4840 RepID=UPI0037444CB6
MSSNIKAPTNHLVSKRVPCRCNECKKKKLGYDMLSVRARQVHYKKYGLLDEVVRMSQDAQQTFADSQDIGGPDDFMEVDTPEILPETIEPVPFPACLGDYEDREEDEARQVSLDFREDFLVDEEDDDDQNHTDPSSTWFPVQVICIFLLLFQERFLSRRGAEVLLEFLNTHLAYISVSVVSSCPQWQPSATLQALTMCGKQVRHLLCVPGAITSTILPTMSSERDFFANSRSFPTMPQQNSEGHETRPLSKYATGATLPPRSLRSKRSTRPGVMYDVYDGRMWTQVPGPDSTPGHHSPFVNMPRSLLVTLNIDWFQAFDKKGPYSVGAIYMTVKNLLRAERYQKENIILVGIIPGPREPKK